MSAIDLDRLCRLCGVEKSRMQSIFDNEQGHSLGNIIEDIVRLSVDRDDGLPQKVCRTCTGMLLQLNESVELFRDTDLKLRKQLQLLPILPHEIKQEEEMEMDSDMLDGLCQQELEVEDLKMVDAEQEELTKHKDEIKHIDEDVKPEVDNEDNKTEEKPLKEPKQKRVRKKRIKEESTEKKAKRPYRKRDPNKPFTRRKDPSQLQKNDHKCYICNDTSIDSAEALVVHLYEHNDQLPYKCTECVMEEVVIKAVSTLNLHKRMHLNPEKCSKCDKRFVTKGSLQLHIDSAHADTEPVACEHCGKIYPSTVALSFHMRLHTSSASCEYCGKTFANASKLKKHITRIHSGVKHECQLCHKMLSSLDALQSHIKAMHSTEEFKCSICPRTYTTELSLRAHMKRHQDNPNYEPSKQWQDYYTIVEGDEGIKNGVRLKKCNICGEIRSQIGTHLQSVHFPVEFRCDICQESFKRKHTYEAHLRKKHHTDGRDQVSVVASSMQFKSEDTTSELE